MNIVGITSCPSGVAHTYMAAEALEQAAKAQGINIKVETQGSGGTENTLSTDDIKKADFVVLSNDTELYGTNRFKGKKVVQLSTTQMIAKSGALMKKLQSMAK